MAGDIVRRATIQFGADTSVAQAQIQALAQSLQSALNAGSANSTGISKVDKEIQQATIDAAKLETTLKSAVNTSTGKLDLTKFNDSLKKSNMDLQKYQTSLGTLGSTGNAAFTNLARSIATAEVPLRRTSSLLTQMGVTLKNTIKWNISSSLINNFVSSVQSAFTYAEKLNNSLNKIQIVTGESAAQMAKFAEDANKAAQRLSTTTRAYTDAALIFYQQGLGDAEVKARTDAVIKMANVTGDAAKEVSNYMTAIWNNFDNGTSSLESFEDKIVSLGATTASSSAEIAAGLEKFASIGQTIGLSFDYAAAALSTVVAETRQSADTVGTAFRTLFSRLQGLKLGETLDDGTTLNKYSAALATVGVQIKDTSGQLKSMDTILNDLAKNWNNLDRAQKTALAQTVGGARQYTTLIALMENWDQFQKNLTTEANSGGALNKQAETYAQSWQAAKDQVTASVESIYQTLIDDKFFIGFNQNLAKVISSVGDFIKNIGGVHTVLLTLGSIATNVFSTQIADGIDRAINNMKMLTATGQEQMLALKQQASTMLSTTAVDTGTIGGGSMALAYKQEAEAQLLLVNNAKNLSAQEQAIAEILLRQVASRVDQQKVIAEQYDKEDQELEKLQNKLERIATVSNGGTWLKELKQDLTDIRNANGDVEVVENTIVTLNQKLKSLGNDTSTEQFKNGFKELQEIVNGLNFDNLSITAQNALTELQKAFKTTPASVEDLQQAILRFGLSSDNAITAVEGRIEELKQELVNLQSQQSFGPLTSENANRLSYLQTIIPQMEQYASKARLMGTTLGELRSAQAATGQSAAAMATLMEQAGIRIYTTGEKISTYARTLTTLATVVRTVINVFKTFADSSKSPGEKILTLVGAIGLLTPMIISSVSALKSLGTSMAFAALVTGTATTATNAMTIAEAKATAATMGLGAAIKTALPILAAVGAAVLIVIGVISALTNKEQTYIESAKDRQSKLSDSVNNLKTKLETLKTAAETVKNTFDEYDSVRTTLDSCKEGTQEWFDALSDVEQKYSEILANTEFREFLINASSYGYNTDNYFDAATGRYNIRAIAADYADYNSRNQTAAGYGLAIGNRALNNTTYQTNTVTGVTEKTTELDSNTSTLYGNGASLFGFLYANGQGTDGAWFDYSVLNNFTAMLSQYSGTDYSNLFSYDNNRVSQSAATRDLISLGTEYIASNPEFTGSLQEAIEAAVLKSVGGDVDAQQAILYAFGKPGRIYGSGDRDKSHYSAFQLTDYLEDSTIADLEGYAISQRATYRNKTTANQVQASNEFFGSMTTAQRAAMPTEVLSSLNGSTAFGRMIQSDYGKAVGWRSGIDLGPAIQEYIANNTDFKDAKGWQIHSDGTIDFYSTNQTSKQTPETLLGSRTQFDVWSSSTAGQNKIKSVNAWDMSVGSDSLVRRAYDAIPEELRGFVFGGDSYSGYTRSEMASAQSAVQAALDNKEGPAYQVLKSLYGSKMASKTFNPAFREAQDVFSSYGIEAGSTSDITLSQLQDVEKMPGQWATELTRAGITKGIIGDARELQTVLDVDLTQGQASIDAYAAALESVGYNMDTLLNSPAWEQFRTEVLANSEVVSTATKGLGQLSDNNITAISTLATGKGINAKSYDEMVSAGLDMSQVERRGNQYYLSEEALSGKTDAFGIGSSLIQMGGLQSALEYNEDNQMYSIDTTKLDNITREMLAARLNIAVDALDDYDWSSTNDQEILSGLYSDVINYDGAGLMYVSAQFGTMYASAMKAYDSELADEYVQAMVQKQAELDGITLTAQELEEWGEAGIDSIIEDAEGNSNYTRFKERKKRQSGFTGLSSSVKSKKDVQTMQGYIESDGVGLTTTQQQAKETFQTNMANIAGLEAKDINAEWMEEYADEVEDLISGDLGTTLAAIKTINPDMPDEEAQAWAETLVEQYSTKAADTLTTKMSTALSKGKEGFNSSDTLYERRMARHTFQYEMNDEQRMAGYESAGFIKNEQLTQTGKEFLLAHGYNEQQITADGFDFIGALYSAYIDSFNDAINEFDPDTLFAGFDTDDPIIGLWDKYRKKMKNKVTSSDATNLITLQRSLEDADIGVDWLTEAMNWAGEKSNLLVTALSKGNWGAGTTSWEDMERAFQDVGLNINDLPADVQRQIRKGLEQRLNNTVSTAVNGALTDSNLSDSMNSRELQLAKQKLTKYTGRMINGVLERTWNDSAIDEYLENAGYLKGGKLTEKAKLAGYTTVDQARQAVKDGIDEGIEDLDIDTYAKRLPEEIRGEFRTAMNAYAADNNGIIDASMLSNMETLYNTVYKALGKFGARELTNAIAAGRKAGNDIGDLISAFGTIDWTAENLTYEEFVQKLEAAGINVEGMDSALQALYDSLGSAIEYTDALTAALNNYANVKGVAEKIRDGEDLTQADYDELVRQVGIQQASDMTIAQAGGGYKFNEDYGDRYTTYEALMADVSTELNDTATELGNFSTWAQQNLTGQGYYGTELIAARNNDANSYEQWLGTIEANASVLAMPGTVVDTEAVGEILGRMKTETDSSAMRSQADELATALGYGSFAELVTATQTLIDAKASNASEAATDAGTAESRLADWRRAGMAGLRDNVTNAAGGAKTAGKLSEGANILDLDNTESEAYKSLKANVAAIFGISDTSKVTDAWLKAHEEAFADIASGERDRVEAGFAALAADAGEIEGTVDQSLIDEYIDEYVEAGTNEVKSAVTNAVTDLNTGLSGKTQKEILRGRGAFNNASREDKKAAMISAGFMTESGQIEQEGIDFIEAQGLAYDAGADVLDQLITATQTGYTTALADSRTGAKIDNMRDGPMKDAALELWNNYISAMGDSFKLDDQAQFISMAQKMAQYGVDSSGFAELMSQVPEEYMAAFLSVVQGINWEDFDPSQVMLDLEAQGIDMSALPTGLVEWLGSQVAGTISNLSANAVGNIMSNSSVSSKNNLELDRAQAGLMTNGEYDTNKINRALVKQGYAKYNWETGEYEVTDAARDAGYETITAAQQAVIDGMDAAVDAMDVGKYSKRLEKSLQKPFEEAMALFTNSEGKQIYTDTDLSNTKTLMRNAASYGGTDAVTAMNALLTAAKNAGADISTVISTLSGVDLSSMGTEQLIATLNDAGIETAGWENAITALIGSMQSAITYTNELAAALGNYSKANGIMDKLQSDAGKTAAAQKYTQEDYDYIASTQGVEVADEMFSQLSEGGYELTDRGRASEYYDATKSNLIAQYQSAQIEAEGLNAFAHQDWSTGYRGGTLETGESLLLGANTSNRAGLFDLIVGNANRANFSNIDMNRAGELQSNFDTINDSSATLAARQDAIQAVLDILGVSSVEDMMAAALPLAEANLSRAEEANTDATARMNTYDQMVTMRASGQLDGMSQQQYDNMITGQMTTEMGDLGFDTKAFGEMIEYLESLPDYADLSRESILNLAKMATRWNQGVEDGTKNMDSWTEALKEGNKEADKGGKTTDKYRKAIEGLEETYDNILNLDPDSLSDGFLESEKNAELLQKAIEGDEQALNELQGLAAQDVLAQFNADNPDMQINVGAHIDTEGFQGDMNELLAAMASYDWEANGIEVGASIEDTPFWDAISQMTVGSAEAADAISNALSSIGVDATFEEHTVPMGTGQAKISPSGSLMVPQLDDAGQLIGYEEAAPKGSYTINADDGTATFYTIKGATYNGSGVKTPGGGTRRPSSRGGGCFEAGTLITTINGYKNIEDIQVGDIVLSYNEELQRNEYSQVLETMIHVVVDNIYTLHIKDDSLVVTGIHRFYIKRMGRTMWIAAANLHVNDIVLFADGTWHLIEAIDIEYKAAVVYNFEVSGNHNYYVGKNRILAHNKGGGGGGRRAETGDKKRKEKRYVTNTNQLEDLQDKLEKINKAEERSYGRNRIKQMQDKVKALKDLAAKQHDLYEEAKNYQKADADKLKEQVEIMNKLGKTGIKIEYDENGTILNRDDIEQKMVDWYNSFTKDTKNEDGEYELKSGVSKAQWKEVQEAYQDMQDYLDKYDESQDKVKEYWQAYLDSINEAYDVIVEMANYKVEVQVEVSDEALNLLDHMLGKIEDDAYKAAEAIAYMGEQMFEYQAQDAINTAGIRDILAHHDGKSQYADDEGNLHTTSNITKDLANKGFSVTDLMEGNSGAWKVLMSKEKEFTQDELDSLQDMINAKLEATEKMMETQKEVYEQISNVFDKGTEDMDRIINKMDHLQSITESYSNIVDLVGRKRLGITNDMMDEFEMSSVEQSLAKLRATRTEMETQKTMLSDLQNQFKNGRNELSDEQRAAFAAQAKQVRESTKSSREELAANEKKLEQLQKQKDLHKSTTNLDLAEAKARKAALLAEYEAAKKREEEEAAAQKKADEAAKKAGKRAGGGGRTRTSSEKSAADIKKELDSLNSQIKKLNTNEETYAKKQQASIDALQTRIDEEKDNVTLMEEKLELYDKLAQSDSVELTERDLELLSDQMEHMEDAIQESTETFYSSWEEAITKISELYTNMMARAIEDASDKLAGQMGSLTELADAFDKKQQENELYVEDFRKIYELSKLNRDIVNSIDETQNVKAKQRLVEYQAELNQLEKDREKMSEYEIENARRRYELLLAELALEESKNAKSQVQMTRNDSGEWSYVYTADETEVEKAEQDYEDKLYAMQRANADYINELQQNIVDMEQAMMDEIESIRVEDYANREEYENAIRAIYDHYGVMMDGYMDQMGIVFGENQRLYTEDWAIYSEMTGYKISEDEEYIDKWNETTLGKKTGFDRMEDFHQNFNDVSQELFDENMNAYDTWESYIEDAMVDAGTATDEFADKMNEDVGEMTQQADQLANTMNETAETVVEAFDQMTEALSNWQAEYSKSIEEMLEKNEALAKSFNNLLKEWSGYNETVGQDPTTGSGDNDDGDDGGGVEDPGTPATQGEQEEPESAKDKTKRLKKGVAAAVWGYPGGAGWGHGNSSRKLTSGDRYRRFKEKGLIPDEVQQQINRYSKYRDGRNGGRSGMMKDAGVTWKDYKKYTYKGWGFDTGGYTGDWEGGDGRLAILHSKEIVLNQDDTKNFLAGIEILRDITKTIDINAMANAGYMANIARIGGVNAGQLQQQVTITAEFPNATDKDSIKEAFNDLINLASQYANRK